CAPIRHLLLRPAAMAAEFDSVAVKLLFLLQMAECDVDQRQMPAQMNVEEAIRKNSPHWAWLGSFRTPVYDAARFRGEIPWLIRCCAAVACSTSPQEPQNPPTSWSRTTRSARSARPAARLRPMRPRSRRRGGCCIPVS